MFHLKNVGELEESDPNIVRRQIGIVDSYGNTTTYSGNNANGFSSHVLGGQLVAMAMRPSARAKVMEETAGLDLAELLKHLARPALGRPAYLPLSRLI